VPKVTRSRFAPARFPRMPAVEGVRLAVYSAGIKYRGRPDILLAALDSGTTVAGSFTRSSTASAPVSWCRKQVPRGRVRALLVNSGNANAFTGAQGIQVVRWAAGAVAQRLACRPSDVLIASTGVIGEPLPIERINAALPKLVDRLGRDGWPEAARAITTTDTFSKGVSRVCQIAGQRVTLSGIAKGSGMIAPDMATMLVFVFTDARISADILQSLHSVAVGQSFNCITVDSDTSTSDSVVLAATGKAMNQRPSRASDPILKDFRKALLSLYVDLATQVVKDGEGASKFITVDVSGASSRTAARVVGLAIANSPLVKTAMAGEDANWGRIVMAVGKSGARVDQSLLSVSIGGVMIARAGERIESFVESDVEQHLKGTDILIAVDLGLGRGRARIWTCDLTHEYIRINAEYRS